MTLYQEVLAELAELDVDDRTLDLVMASLIGKEALEKVLAGEPPDHSVIGNGQLDQHPTSVYLQDVTVSGFRGIGPEVTLDIRPGPGLTVVVGQRLRQVQPCRGAGSLAYR